MAPKMTIEMLAVLSMFFLVMNLCGKTVLAQYYSDSSSCTNVLLSLSPCLDYITEKASAPTSECCSQLANVVGSQPQCLCEVVNGGASSIGASLNINLTQVLALPSACRFQTPSISICSSSGSSVSSPTGVSVSSIPNSPAGIGSNIVPSTTGGSGGSGYSFHWNSSSTKLTSSCLLLMSLFATMTLAFSFLTTI